MAVWENNEEEFSEALKSVRLWWKPVEAAIRSRRADLLQGALKEAHGESYLRTLPRNDGAGLCMQCAEVQVWTLLIAIQLRWKWLQDWSKHALFLGNGRLVLRRSRKLIEREMWRVLLKPCHGFSTLLMMRRCQFLKEAIERRDVPKLREAIIDMSRDGPTNIEGAEEAKKMIKRYQIRARALDHAVGERKINSIQAALSTWDFSRDDIHAVKARQAIARRDQQKQKLHDAVHKRDGPRLNQVVNDWEFDRNDEDQGTDLGIRPILLSGKASKGL
eukprot:g22693.t1